MSENITDHLFLKYFKELRGSEIIGCLGKNHKDCKILRYNDINSIWKDESCFELYYWNKNDLLDKIIVCKEDKNFKKFKEQIKNIVYPSLLES